MTNGNPVTTPLAPYEDELRRISGLPTEPALRRAASLLARLVGDRAFLRSLIPPLLEEARYGEDWYVAHRHDAEDGAYSLQTFVWPPKTGTNVHDHSSWGAFHCAFGSVLEERYERVDDASVSDHARLKKSWQLAWGPKDGASTVLPGNGGIHRVTNLGEEVAVSVHLYGPRQGEADGRDYDLSQNYVCDRRA